MHDSITYAAYYFIHPSEYPQMVLFYALILAALGLSLLEKRTGQKNFFVSVSMVLFIMVISILILTVRFAAIEEFNRLAYNQPVTIMKVVASPNMRNVDLYYKVLGVYVKSKCLDTNQEEINLLKMVAQRNLPLEFVENQNSEPMLYGDYAELDKKLDFGRKITMVLDVKTTVFLTESGTARSAKDMLNTISFIRQSITEKAKPTSSPIVVYSRISSVKHH